MVSRNLDKEEDGLRSGFRGGLSLDRVEDSVSDGRCNEGRVGLSILGICTIFSCGC